MSTAHVLVRAGETTRTESATRSNRSLVSQDNDRAPVILKTDTGRRAHNTVSNSQPIAPGAPPAVSAHQSGHRLARWRRLTARNNPSGSKAKGFKMSESSRTDGLKSDQQGDYETEAQYIRRLARGTR